MNPQRERADNGELWSRFFTESCHIPLVLSRREREVLGRLVAHLLPFRLPERSPSMVEQHDERVLTDEPAGGARP